MTETQLTDEIASAVAFVLLFVLIKLIWSLHVDSLRERLFALRDEMMLYSFDAGLIENPAYRNLRFLINGLIRYAHRLSFAKLMMIAWGHKRLGIRLDPPREFVEWSRAIEGLPPEERKQFEEFHSRAILLVTRHMVLRSPLVWLMAICVLAHVALIRPTRFLWDSTLKALEPKMPIDLALSEAMKAARA